jgi:hypothetical protein
VATGLQLVASSWSAKNSSIIGFSKEARQINRRLALLKKTALNTCLSLLKQMPVREFKTTSLFTKRQVNFICETGLFSYHAGLPFSQIFKVNCRNIITMIDGTRWIAHDLDRSDLNLIPLSNEALQILDKYEPPFIPDNDGRIFNNRMVR